MKKVLVVATELWPAVLPKVGGLTVYPFRPIGRSREAPAHRIPVSLFAVKWNFDRWASASGGRSSCQGNRGLVLRRFIALGPIPEEGKDGPATFSLLFAASVGPVDQDSLKWHFVCGSGSVEGSAR